MNTPGTSAQNMHGMFTAHAARPVSGSAAAYRWHRIRCTAVIEVNTFAAKLPAPRRLSEAPL